MKRSRSKSKSIGQGRPVPAVHVPDRHRAGDEAAGWRQDHQRELDERSSRPTLSTHYCASKGAAITFTKACATGLRGDNITVNSICPGPTATDMLVVYPGMADRVQEAAADTSSGPSRRIGRPDDIAGAAVFLASDEAAWISCALLVVDGGGTAS
jgi:NAD(P)-dependent dehydrogenase (short-subunit alcohol dehydrogenase family)